MFSKTAGRKGTIDRAINSSNIAIWTFLSIWCFSCLSCADKENRVAGEKKASAAEAVPHVEDPVVLPGIKSGANEITIVYKDTRFGILENQGVDTKIYRFQLLPGEWISGAAVYERQLAGETPVASYTFSRAGNETLVSRTNSGGATMPASLTVEQRKIVIGGDAERALSFSKDGSFKISAGDNDYVEEYRRGDKPLSGTMTVLRRGDKEKEGIWSAAQGAKYVFAEQGSEARTISLWIDDKNDESRFRTEGVESINEVYAKGLAACFRGEHGLENFALIDYVLGGKENDIRPVLTLWLMGNDKAGR